MAKKNKRQSRRDAMTPSVTPSSSTGSSSSGRQSDFNPNYTYILHDLRRIGILAGSFFAILIVLSFFLH